MTPLFEYANGYRDVNGLVRISEIFETDQSNILENIPLLEFLVNLRSLHCSSSFGIPCSSRVPPLSSRQCSRNPSFNSDYFFFFEESKIEDSLK